MKNKKISTNIPGQLLSEATKLTGYNQTEALIAGLHELINQAKRKNLISLRGKIAIDLNVAKSRNRFKT